jgi:hypothetical protein
MGIMKRLELRVGEPVQQKRVEECLKKNPQSPFLLLASAFEKHIGYRYQNISNFYQSFTYKSMKDIFLAHQNKQDYEKVRVFKQDIHQNLVSEQI